MKERYTLNIVIVLLFGVRLLWSTPVLATDYYVHADIGSNTNSGLHPDDAFADMDYATIKLQAGDTLHLRSGIYTNVPILSTRLHRSGTSALPIVVRNYMNDIATIRSEGKFVIKDLSWWSFEDFIFSSAPFKLGMDDTSLPESSQCTSFAENITFKNIRFQHSSKRAITLRCANHIRIEDNIFNNLRSRTEGDDVQAIALQYVANDVVISGNIFRDIGADGIHMLNRPGGQYTNIHITNNEFEIVRPYRYRDEDGNVVPVEQQPFDNVGENGIDIKQGPGPIVVSNNRFHGFIPALPGQDASGGGSGVAIHEYARGITIRRNHFYNNVHHLTVGRGHNIEEYPDRDLVISNNIFEEKTFQSNFEGWKVLGIHISNARNISIINNTFQTQPHDKMTLIRFNKLSEVALFNNIFQDGIVEILYDGSMELIADHNAWSGILDREGRKTEVDLAISGIHDVLADDLKIDWETKMPLAGSPLIDAALPVGITYDFNGTTVSGQGPDIGAVERQISLNNSRSNISGSSIASTNEKEDGSTGGCTVGIHRSFDPLFILILIITTAGIFRHQLFGGFSTRSRQRVEKQSH